MSDASDDDACLPIHVSSTWPSEWEKPKGGLLTEEFINRDAAIQSEVIRRLNNREVDNETSHPNCLYNPTLRTVPGTESVVTRSDVNFFRQLKGMPTIEEEEEANRPEPEPEIELPVTIIRGKDINNKEAVEPDTLPAVEEKDDDQQSVISLSSSTGVRKKKKKGKKCSIQ
eukprot:TRINITY_DN38286_c0_g1_i1.p1 TRINITY_DN38286_c0_g1~~TRINITY_DN38286_c0_g1_i1.p1  ORF type:complete len:171 (+),score=51.59 TRINITY_DN38286_c0_g1_i1:109-621(+)